MRFFISAYRENELVAHTDGRRKSFYCIPEQMFAFSVATAVTCVVAMHQVASAIRHLWFCEVWPTPCHPHLYFQPCVCDCYFHGSISKTGFGQGAKAHVQIELWNRASDTHKSNVSFRENANLHLVLFWLDLTATGAFFPLHPLSMWLHRSQLL